MNLRKMLGILLVFTLLIPMAAFAEDVPEAESILEADYSGFRQVDPHVEYVKSPFPGGFVNLRWAPSGDAAVQHRMNDGDELIVYAKDASWAQVMDTESGFIGFVRSEFLTEKEPELVAEVTENTEGVEKAFVDFDIKMDSIPEGYTFETEERGGSLNATFMPDDPTAVSVYVSVTYSPIFAGRTVTKDISEEEMNAAREVLTADYNDPQIEIRETEYGTALFVVTEGDAQTDYADMISVWQGYVFRIDLQKPTELTDADYDIATKIASDMWITEE